MSVRWMVTEKVKDGNTFTKARIVACSFEEDLVGLHKDLPTCTREAVHLAISLALSKGWKCHTVDGKAACLQGNKTERDIYLKPPPEFFNGMLWKLERKKNVYGLANTA